MAGAAVIPYVQGAWGSPMTVGWEAWPDRVIDPAAKSVAAAWALAFVVVQVANAAVNEDSVALNSEGDVRMNLGTNVTAVAVKVQVGPV